MVSIDSITPIDGQLSDRRLLEVIEGAWRELLPGIPTLLCYLSDRTRPLMEQLSAKGLVEWELVQNPHSQDARILRVSADYID